MFKKIKDFFKSVSEMECFDREEELKILLDNAISLLAEETLDTYDNPIDWFEWVKHEIGITEQELKEYCGISIDKNGELCLW